MLILLPIINVSCVSVRGLFICVFVDYYVCVSLCGYVHLSVGVSRGQEMGVSLGVWVTGDCEPWM